MYYREYQPHPALAELVKCFWVLEDDSVPEDFPRERILPDGCTEMIFHYGDHYHIFQKDKAVTQVRSFVFGQLKEFIEIGPSGKTGMIAIRFYPAGMAAMHPAPMHELTGRFIGVAELFGKAGRELEERILSSGSTADRIDHLEAFILSRITNSQTQNPVVAACVQRLNESGGAARIGDLSREFNIGLRQLERKFHEQVGMSPKYYARIVRFQRIFSLLERGELNSLTALAIEAGYFDQAHFIKEFRQFSGENPNRYISRDHAFSNYFTAGN